MSQLKLETVAGLSFGTVSRIENNLINPTKETILKISDVMKLNSREIDYLVGSSAFPVTSEEILLAVEEAKDVLGKRGKLAYLLDDRWRFFAVSNTFLKFLGMSKDDLGYVIGKTTAQIIVDEKSPAMKWLHEDHVDELLNLYLPQYYSEMSFMNDDPSYIRTVKDIMRNPRTSVIWQEVVKKGIRKYASEEELVINFNVLGKNLPLYYYGHTLAENPRFTLVEFRTKNKLLDILAWLT